MRIQNRENFKIMTRWYFRGLNMSDEGCSTFSCNPMTFEESLEVTGFIIRISVRNIISLFKLFFRVICDSIKKMTTVLRT